MPTFVRNGSKRVGFSPYNTNDPIPHQFRTSCIDTPSTRSRECQWRSKQKPARFQSLPARLLCRIRANVTRTLSLFSTKQPPCGRTRPSDPMIPMHFIPPRDSHHSEAMEDCIEFINSSHRKSL